MKNLTSSESRALPVAAHSPGPWRIASFNKNPSLCLRVWSGEIEVCQINHWGKPERDLTCDPKPTGQAEANARLIAAAPELLAALESLDHASGVYQAVVHTAGATKAHGSLVEAHKQARTAIAKAKGQA